MAYTDVAPYFRLSAKAWPHVHGSQSLLFLFLGPQKFCFVFFLSNSITSHFYCLPRFASGLSFLRHSSLSKALPCAHTRVSFFCLHQTQTPLFSSSLINTISICKNLSFKIIRWHTLMRHDTLHSPNLRFILMCALGFRIATKINVNSTDYFMFNPSSSFGEAAATF